MEITETHMHSTYIALIHKTKKKNADYGVIFPDFPGCAFGGETIELALENAREGIIFHTEGLLDTGELLPQPTSLEKIKTMSDYNTEVIPALVRIILPTGHLKRLNISMDTGLITEIDTAAKKIGKTRSEFLADAAKHMLA